MNLRQAFPPRRYNGQDLDRALGPGVTPVTIEGWDFEHFNNRDKKGADVLYRLHFRELKLPIKLTKTLGEQIAGVLGSFEMDDWIGQVVGLRPRTTMIDGEEVWIITCDIERPRTDPRLPYKADLIRIAADQRRREIGPGSGGAPAHHQPGGAAVSPGPRGYVNQPGSPASEPIGKARAAGLVEQLERRGKTWAECRTWLREQRELQDCESMPPWELPAAFANEAWRFAKSFPAVHQGRNEAEILRSWERAETAQNSVASAGATPPRQLQQTPGGESFDPATGEVVDHPPTGTKPAASAAGGPSSGDYTPIDEDDIPF